GLRHDPLSEPEAGGRLRARARRAHPAVSARDRTAARLLDRAGGIHGERRDAAGVRRTRIPGRGARRSQDRLAAVRGARAARRTGARLLPRRAAAGELWHRPGEPRGRAGRGGRHSLGRHRVSQHRFHAAPLPRGSGRRTRGTPLHDDRPASGARPAGLIDALRVARGTMPRCRRGWKNMTFVVTENCIKCKYMDCVEVCPEDCIDCTLCEPECPVEAIFSEEELPNGQEHFKQLNAELAKNWPVITEKKDAPADAKEWEGKPDKLKLLER